MTRTDTIVAAATPPGRGGIGIVRVSGPEGPGDRRGDARRAAAGAPRHLHALPRRAGGEPVDAGLALFFPAPHSYTGEHVLELHGHGGPVVLEALIARALELGARRALPGEFTQRAFLNDKLDLAQAEAIADLIDAGSREAARAAMRSLQGEFSAMVRGLTEAVIELRSYVEAAIDFPEEEIDFLADRELGERFQAVRDHFEGVLAVGAPGTPAARGHDGGDRRAPQCRQVEPAQPPRRLRRGDRHRRSRAPRATSARAHRDRRHAAARARHRRPARGGRRPGRGGGHPARAGGDGARRPRAVRHRCRGRSGRGRLPRGAGAPAQGRARDAGLQQVRPRRRPAGRRHPHRSAARHGLGARGQRAGGAARAPEALHGLPERGERAR